MEGDSPVTEAELQATNSYVKKIAEFRSVNGIEPTQISQRGSTHCFHKKDTAGAVPLPIVSI